MLRAHLPELRAFVTGRCRCLPLQRESVEDILQWVCLEVVRQIDDFTDRGPSCARAWLFRVATNVIGNRIQYWRRASRSASREIRSDAEHLVQQPGDTQDPYEAGIERERLQMVDAALDSLPPIYGEVVRRARFREESAAEIAAAIGRTPTAVRVLLCRAMRQLRDTLREPPGDVSGA